MAWVNGGAIMTSRRVRGPAAHRAAGGEPPLASRGMQNSQRVHDTKARTAPMARRRDGDIAPYRQAARGRRHGNGARAGRTARGHEVRTATGHGVRGNEGGGVARGRGRGYQIEPQRTEIGQ